MNDIKQSVNSIFKKYTKYDFLSNIDLQNEKLLGAKLKISPRTLVYILFELEKTLNFEIEQNIIIKGDFDTFTHVCMAVRL